MATLEEVLADPKSWPDDTPLGEIETSMYVSTASKEQRAVNVDWTLANGTTEVQLAGGRDC